MTIFVPNCARFVTYFNDFCLWGLAHYLRINLEKFDQPLTSRKNNPQFLKVVMGAKANRRCKHYKVGMKMCTICIGISMWDFFLNILFCFRVMIKKLKFWAICTIFVPNCVRFASYFHDFCLSDHTQNLIPNLEKFDKPYDYRKHLLNFWKL